MSVRFLSGFTAATAIVFVQISWPCTHSFKQARPAIYFEGRQESEINQLTN